MSHGVQAVRERGGDAEVAAAAAQRPEEVRVRVGVDVEHLAVRRDELDGRAGCPPRARAWPSASRGRRRGCSRRCRSSRPRRRSPPGRARRRRRSARPRSRRPRRWRSRARDRPRSRFISARSIITPAVGDGAPGDVVAAAADRDLEPVAAREGERGDDVARPSGSGRSPPAGGRRGRCGRPGPRRSPGPAGRGRARRPVRPGHGRVRCPLSCSCDRSFRGDPRSCAVNLSGRREPRDIPSARCQRERLAGTLTVRSTTAFSSPRRWLSSLERVMRRTGISAGVMSP